MSLLAPAAVVVVIVVWLGPLASNRPRRLAQATITSVKSPRWRFDRTVRRRRRPAATSPAAVAEWADHLSRTLRHGATLHAALATTEPSDPDLAARCEPLQHWLARGSTVVDACDEWSDELGRQLGRQRGRRTELLTTTAAVVAAVAMLGGTAAEPIDRLAATMRQHVSDDLERLAHAAQAKMSAQVLTIVPLAVLVLLLLADDDVRSVVGRPTGLAVVLIGLTINGIGAVWMRHIASGGVGSISQRGTGAPTP